MNAPTTETSNPSTGSTGIQSESPTKTVSDETRQAASGAARDVKAGFDQHAGAARDAVASEVGDVARALRTAADQMRSGSPQERTMAQIADGLAEASEAMRAKDMGQMVDDLSTFARRNPIAFLGGAALVGFAATRFAKASAQPDVLDTSNRDMDRMVASHATYGEAL